MPKNNETKHKKDLTIVTFLWGKWYERELEYLTKLRNMLQRNIKKFDYEFVCLTNRPNLRTDGIKFKPLYCPSRYRNLPKLSLFNPRYDFSNKVFAVDLDIIFLNNIDHILSLNDCELCVRAAFKTRNKRWKPDGDMQLLNMNKRRRYETWKFILNRRRLIEQRTKGAERRFYEYYAHSLFNGVKYLQKEFPNQIRSFKQDKINITKEVPDGTNIVTFHGKPKPHECLNDQLWLNDYWI